MRRLFPAMLAILLIASGCTGSSKDGNTPPPASPSPGPAGELKGPCLPTRTDVVFVIFVANYRPDMNNGQGGYSIATYQTDNGPDPVDPKSIVPNLEESKPGKNGRLVWSVAPYVTPLGGYALMKLPEGPIEEVALEPDARQIVARPGSTITTVHFCGTMKIGS